MIRNVRWKVVGSYPINNVELKIQFWRASTKSCTFFACVLKMLATFTKDDNYNYTAHIEKEQKPHALVFKAISHVVPLILSLYLSFTRLLSPKKKHVQMEVLFFFPEIHFDKLDKLCLLHTIT